MIFPLPLYLTHNSIPTDATTRKRKYFYIIRAFTPREERKPPRDRHLLQVPTVPPPCCTNWNPHTPRTTPSETLKEADLSCMHASTRCLTSCCAPPPPCLVNNEFEPIEENTNGALFGCRLVYVHLSKQLWNVAIYCQDWVDLCVCYIILN